MNLSQGGKPTGDIKPFPISRYVYGGFRYYYAYGNSPAEDFLRSCVGKKQPSILLLGCGDIRSCFYTLWKNFDISIPNSPQQFSGIDFVLNDWSTPVLARNIVFIFLCLKLPSSEGERKKWLSALWAVWYCHELHPQHQKILDDCLKSLLKYSKSLSVWACLDNPLHHLVYFTSSAVLAEISTVWKIWLGKRGCISVKQMHSSRRMEFQQSGLVDRMNKYTSEPSFVLSSILNGETASIETYEIPEVISYIKSGNCYAERVFDITSLSSSVTANLTFFERQDHVYSVEWCSLPFRSYHLTRKMSPDSMKQAGVGKRVCDGIRSEHFESHPFLATCVQQFSMWLQSSSAVLNEEKIVLSFTFNNQDALAFCQEQQQSSSYSDHFDAIFSSNLLDHIGPPNMILSTLPLLKLEGLIFTTTFHYDEFACTAEDYLNICFGFACKLLPEILGVQCTNYEGDDCAAPVNTLMQLNREHKLLIWNKISAERTKAVSDLPGIGPSNITKKLLDTVAVSNIALIPMFESAPDRHRVLSYSNTETAILVLQTFKSLVNAGDDYQFWEPLSNALLEFDVFSPFLMGLQTQALLHNLHMHLAFPCPICKHVPVEECIGLFCAELSLPFDTPFACSNFMAFVHSSPTLWQDNQKLTLMGLSSKDVAVIDSIDGIVDGNTLKLKFFAPLLFVTHDFSFTIGRILMREDGGNVVQMIFPVAKIKAVQIKFEGYSFSQTMTRNTLSNHSDYASAESHAKMKCSFCGSSGIMKMCKQCKKARYCDRECQVKHWPRHKHNCKVLAMTKAIQQLQLLPSLPPEAMHCAYCDCSSSKLKACARCKKVKYCGQECQRKHWKSHRGTCS